MKTIRTLAVGLFKMAFLGISYCLVWGILVFVTAYVLQSFPSLTCSTATSECEATNENLFMFTAIAEFIVSLVFVAWVLVWFEKRSEKQKRKEKTSFA